MSTSKIALKVRLTPETYTELHQLHSGYGEAGGIVRQLIEAYIQRKRSSASARDIENVVQHVVEGGQHGNNTEM